MARTRLPDTARVSIGLRVSEADAARIDQVLARPEFEGWSRSEWCVEIIRSALRYYAGDPPSPVADQAPASPQPADPEPPTRTDCSHPQDARDYQTGTCAACGAILWD